MSELTGELTGEIKSRKRILKEIFETNRETIIKKYLDGVPLKEIQREFKIKSHKTLHLFLKKENIKLRNNYTQTEHSDIINKYQNKVSVKKIAKKYKRGVSSILNVLKKHNIEISDTQDEFEKYGRNEPDSNYIKLKKIIIERNIPGTFVEDKGFFFVTLCTCCKKEIRFRCTKLLRNLNTGTKPFCKDCLKGGVFNNIMQSTPKRKTNTIGYIGIDIYKNQKQQVLGYNARLKLNKKVILNTKFYDPLLTKKTLIQAAMTREIFILENKYSHTRNFTDDELISNMEYLHYTKEDIQRISNILKDYKEFRNKGIE